MRSCVPAYAKKVCLAGTQLLQLTEDTMHCCSAGLLQPSCSQGITTRQLLMQLNLLVLGPAGWFQNACSLVAADMLLLLLFAAYTGLQRLPSPPFLQRRAQNVFDLASVYTSAHA
jgi:hypothetical protein